MEVNGTNAGVAGKKAPVNFVISPPVHTLNFNLIILHELPMWTLAYFEDVAVVIINIMYITVLNSLKESCFSFHSVDNFDLNLSDINTKIVFSILLKNSYKRKVFVGFTKSSRNT